MTESIPAILKKEYGCHRNKMSRTEECFAKQLESSVTTEHILKDLNNLEEKVPFKVYLGIMISLFAAFGLWLMDVMSDGFLVSQYHQEFTVGFLPLNHQDCTTNITIYERSDQNYKTTNCDVKGGDNCNIFGKCFRNS